MMTGRFYRLLDQARAEIERRAPDYLARFPIHLPDPTAVVGRYANAPICAGYSTDALERALHTGLAHMSRSTVAAEPGAGACPIGESWCDSVIDAFCAEQGTLALEPWSDTGQSPAEILAARYMECRGGNAIRYFVRRSGTKPVMLLNATGIPVHVWNRLLSDPSHDFRIVVPERKSGNFVEGGLRGKLDFEEECADLVSVMDAEAIDKLDVIAWCTGARLAVEFAKRYEERISSLILIAPWFREASGGKPSDQITQFEKGLNSILKLVAAEPQLAPALARSVSEQIQITDWSRTGDAVNRAQALFALPAREHSAAMVAPLASVASLVVLAQNAEAERTSGTEDLLKRLRVPMMLLMGTHDHIVNNRLITSVMRKSDRPFVTATVSASGHYVHDLQYSYFRLLLDDFLGNGQVPAATARVSVTCENAANEAANVAGAIDRNRICVELRHRYHANRSASGQLERRQ